MEFILNTDVIAALITLTFLEIVLGINNIVFIAILVGKLPSEQQRRARLIGIVLAVVLNFQLRRRSKRQPVHLRRSSQGGSV